MVEKAAGLSRPQQAIQSEAANAGFADEFDVFFSRSGSGTKTYLGRFHTYPPNCNSRRMVRVQNFSPVQCVSTSWSIGTVQFTAG
jgi:hypothetical protein